MPTVSIETLRKWEEVVEQAMCCIRGETPEDCTFGEAEDHTVERLNEIDAEMAAALGSRGATKDPHERIAELEEALRPFGDASDACDEPAHSDSMSAWETPQAMAVTIGDFRRARSALNTSQG